MEDTTLFDTPAETAPEVTPETPVTPEPTTETPEAAPAKDESKEEKREIIKGVAGFALDKNGQLVILDKMPEKEEPAKVETPAVEAPKAEPIPTHELTWNGQKLVKPLPEVIELAQKGFDYSQKTMSLAEKERALAQREAELAQLIATLKHPAANPEQEATEDNVDKAMRHVMQKFQVDEYDPLDPKQQGEFIRALKDLDAADAQDIQKKAQVEAAAAQREQTLAAWNAQQREKDPEFDKVLDWGLPQLKKIMTAEQHETMNEAFRTGNTVILTKGIDWLRKQYQAHVTGVPTTPRPLPPVVQPTGNGKTRTATEPKRDATVLHTMTADQRIEWIKNNALPKQFK